MGPPSLENKADHSPNWIERPSARMHRGESREGGHDTTRCVGDGPRTTMHRRGPHAGLPRPCPGRNERTGDARHASLRHAAGVRQGKLVSQGTSPYQCAGRWCPLLPLPELSRNQLRPVSVGSRARLFLIASDPADASGQSDPFRCTRPARTARTTYHETQHVLCGALSPTHACPQVQLRQSH